MVASIGKIASPAQGASYYERDGYYAKDDPEHREASRWAGKGAESLGLAGPVDPDTFRQVLEGKVPDGPRLGKRGKDGEIHHRPGRDVTLSAPKSVSLLALVGGDERVTQAHDKAVGNTLAWIEEHAVRTRVQDKATRAMVQAGGRSYAPGDTVIFNRPYKTLGVGRGDERTVARLDHNRHTVVLQDAQGRETPWQPARIAAAKGGVEVYRSEGLVLRAGDRVRWTRNDPGAGLVNGETATVERVEVDSVRFRLEDGSTATLVGGDPRLRHLDRAWAATVHAFQGRTVDRIIAALPTGNPQLTDQRAFYVAVSRARDRAEPVTDDAWKLADQLERATGERVTALEGVAKRAAHERVFGAEPPRDRDGLAVARAREGIDRDAEAGRESRLNNGHGRRAGRGTDRERTEKTREQGSGHGQMPRSAGASGRGFHREDGPPGEPERDAGRDQTEEHKPKSVDMDLGL